MNTKAIAQAIKEFSYVDSNGFDAVNKAGLMIRLTRLLASDKSRSTFRIDCGWESN